MKLHRRYFGPHRRARTSSAKFLCRGMAQFRHPQPSRAPLLETSKPCNPLVPPFLLFSLSLPFSLILHVAETRVVRTVIQRTVSLRSLTRESSLISVNAIRVDQTCPTDEQFLFLIVDRRFAWIFSRHLITERINRISLLFLAAYLDP